MFYTNLKEYLVACESKYVAREGLIFKMKGSYSSKYSKYYKYDLNVWLKAMESIWEEK